MRFLYRIIESVPSYRPLAKLSPWLEHEALQHAASGIAIADADMTIEYANPAFSLAVGKEDQNSLVGRSLFDLAADADAMRSLTGAASQSSAPWKGTVELLSGTGTSLFQACAVNCLDEDGEPCGLILSLGERESPASQAATP